MKGAVGETLQKGQQQKGGTSGNEKIPGNLQKKGGKIGGSTG